MRQARVTALSLASIAAGLAFAPDLAPARGAAERATRLTDVTLLGWSDLFVQNLDADQPARIVGEVRGPSTWWYNFVATAQPEGAAYIRNADPCEMSFLPGIRSVHMASDRPIRAIARADGSEGEAAMIGDAVPATDLVLAPFAMRIHLHKNVSKLIAIQNTDALQAASVTVTLQTYNRRTDLPIVLPPGQTALVHPDTVPKLLAHPMPYGEIRIRSNVPVAAMQFIDMESRATGLAGIAAIEGLPVSEAGEQLFVPAFGHRYVSGPDADPSGRLFDSQLHVVNPGRNIVQVDVSFRGYAGSCQGQTYATQRHEVSPGGALGIGPSVDGPIGIRSGLPVGCLASAVVRARGGGVLATVIDGSVGPATMGHGYAAVAAAAGDTKVHLPAVRRRFGLSLMSTAIHTMNVSDTPVRATLTLRGLDGTTLPTCAACTTTIEPGAAFTWWPQAIPELADGWLGSAMVLGDHPVVALAVDRSADGTWDSASYLALPAQDGRADRQRAFVPALARRGGQCQDAAPPGSFATPIPGTAGPSPSATSSSATPSTASPTVPPDATETAPAPRFAVWLPLTLNDAHLEDWTTR